MSEVLDGGVKKDWGPGEEGRGREGRLGGWEAEARLWLWRPQGRRPASAPALPGNCPPSICFKVLGALSQPVLPRPP